jgi:hypothetical protein
MYNHFEMIVLVRTMPADTIFTLNREVEQFNNPWWLTNGNTETTEDSKARKPKKQMNKDERKQYNQKIMYEYLKMANRNEQIAEKMAKKNAENQTSEIAAQLNIDVDDMDLEVWWQKLQFPRWNPMYKTCTATSTPSQQCVLKNIESALAIVIVN